MVHLYITDVRMLPLPSECPELVNRLSAERQQKLKTLLQKEKQKQCLGAGLLLEKVLAQHGVSADSVRVGKDGKPEVDGIFFNLSHSGDLVICAISDVTVGCDIEKRREVPTHLAERFFSDGEKAYLASFAGETYEREFFRLWTRKESYVKMTGEGMARSLDAFDVFQKNGEKCYFNEHEVEGYQISVCTEEETDLRIEKVNI